MKRLEFLAYEDFVHLRPLGIILGTGLGELAKEIKAEVVIDYGEYRIFPLSTVGIAFMGN